MPPPEATRRSAPKRRSGDPKQGAVELEGLHSTLKKLKQDLAKKDARLARQKASIQRLKAVRAAADDGLLPLPAGACDDGADASAPVDVPLPQAIMSAPKKEANQQGESSAMAEARAAAEEAAALLASAQLGTPPTGDENAAPPAPAPTLAGAAVTPLPAPAYRNGREPAEKVIHTLDAARAAARDCNSLDYAVRLAVIETGEAVTKSVAGRASDAAAEQALAVFKALMPELAASLKEGVRDGLAGLQTSIDEVLQAQRSAIDMLTGLRRGEVSSDQPEDEDEPMMDLAARRNVFVEHLFGEWRASEQYEGQSDEVVRSALLKWIDAKGWDHLDVRMEAFEAAATAEKEVRNALTAAGTPGGLLALLPERSASEIGEGALPAAAVEGAPTRQTGRTWERTPRVPEYQKFCGTTDKWVTDPRTWWDGLQTYVDLAFPGTAIGFKEALLLYSKGALHKWVTHLYAHQPKETLSIEQMRKEFLLRFGPVEQEPEQRVRDELVEGEHRQKPGESVGEYVQRFRELIREAPSIDITTAITFFTRGLNRRLVSDIGTDPRTGKAWTSLEELIAAAEGRERALALSQRARGGASASQRFNRPSLAAVTAPKQGFKRAADTAQGGGAFKKHKPSAPGAARGPPAEDECIKCNGRFGSRGGLFAHLLDSVTKGAPAGCAKVREWLAEPRNADRAVTFPPAVFDFAAGRGVDLSDPRFRVQKPGAYKGVSGKGKGGR